MLNIAIVEDEEAEINLLKEHISRFEKETGELCNIKTFNDGLAFLDGYDHSYDIVLMDIEMPGINGMQASKRLRLLDSSVPLVFVTNMKQFAIEGYSVSALDFILKPINYFRLSTILKKAIHNVAEKSIEIVLKSEGELKKIRLETILYIEVTGRELIYHTETDDIKTYGNLKNFEKEYGEHGFIRCYDCYLVNLKHVSNIKDDMLTIGENKLPISRRKRKELLLAFGSYFGSK